MRRALLIAVASFRAFALARIAAACVQLAGRQVLAGRQALAGSKRARAITSSACKSMMRVVTAVTTSIFGNSFGFENNIACYVLLDGAPIPLRQLHWPHAQPAEKAPLLAAHEQRRRALKTTPAGGSLLYDRPFPSDVGSRSASRLRHCDSCARAEDGDQRRAHNEASGCKDFDLNRIPNDMQVGCGRVVTALAGRHSPRRPAQRE